MSQSCELTVGLGLSTFTFHCGTRKLGEAVNVLVGETKRWDGVKAFLILQQERRNLVGYIGELNAQFLWDSVCYEIELSPNLPLDMHVSVARFD